MLFAGMVRAFCGMGELEAPLAVRPLAEKGCALADLRPLAAALRKAGAG